VSAAPDVSQLGSCPIRVGAYDRVVKGHGSGGRLSQELLESVFLRGLGNPVLQRQEDAATLAPAPGRLAVTTDAFVVHPAFFPGGDIGSLAVHGTVNDLAVAGAVPRYLIASFILEEGLLLSDLARVVASMRAACERAGVQLVAGDTKVVEKGKGDQLFITTTGVGWVPEGRSLSIASARPGDRLLLSGTLGDHGIAILSVREGLTFETEIRSDSAPLNSLTSMLLELSPEIRCMRDPTRGGLASTLNELAAASAVGVEIDEAALPIRPEVRAACELLGLDPLHVANEGKLVAVVPAERAEATLAAARAHPQGREAALIGEVVAAHPKRVTMRSVVGGTRLVSMLAGEQLPRIC